MRLHLEILDISESHSCACMCSVMLVFCACIGRDLYVRVPSGFFLNDTSWAISAKVRVWKLIAMLITIGMTPTFRLPLLCCSIACLSGAYIVCMSSMTSVMLQFVEYLHYMS